MAAPPSQDHRGPLTIAVGLLGTAPASISRDRAVLTFGGSPLRYAGLVASDARNDRLPAWLELQGRTLLIRVQDAQAQYPLTIDPFVQRAQLTSSEQSETFGNSVAISNDAVAVGDGFVDNFKGAVYVFVKPANGWANATETAK